MTKSKDLDEGIIFYFILDCTETNILEENETPRDF